MIMLLPTNPNSGLHTSAAMKRDIKNYEGLRLKAYLCPAGKWTIGYGHTLGVKPGDTIDQERAESLFENDVRTAEAWVKRFVSVKLTQGQFDALVDFIFNFGPGELQGSTLLRLLNAGNAAAAGNQLPRWVYAKNPKTGKMEQLDGLVKRRAKALNKYWKATAL